MPELAKSAEFEAWSNGTGHLLIDGKDFPWHVLEEPTIKASNTGVHELTVSILVGGNVSVTNIGIDKLPDA